ncbi:MAG TPA: polysaccharide deacetylase family protein [Allosphingosinicella sp.]|jgi:peptidoglycan/xylan/chitin deacetylase (PgdA/CDA1 family)|nr:polysaccharide deacetylase family protein [Allosphingosinicella sp.]
MTRFSRGLLAGLFALIAVPAFAAPEPPRQIAFTFDDLPVHGPLPAGETRLGVAKELIAALKAAGLKGVYGFVNGGFAEAAPGSEAVFPAWREAGFPLGNHTWSHPNLNDLSVQDEEAQIARDEPLLQQIAGGADWHWFRYPFLQEGTDPAKREEVRRFLASHGYHIAQVTMDFADYAFNEPYARCMAKGDQAAVAKLEQAYLDSARENARGFRTLSKALYGRDIPYVLLMHIGAFDAHMLPRLLALYRELGFRFVTLPEAERDPAYASDVDPSLPPEPVGLVAKARAKGIPIPPLYTQLPLLDEMCR